jgi:hypothetical protein
MKTSFKKPGGAKAPPGKTPAPTAPKAAAPPPPKKTVTKPAKPLPRGVTSNAAPPAGKATPPKKTAPAAQAEEELPLEEPEPPASEEEQSDPDENAVVLREPAELMRSSGGAGHKLGMPIGEFTAADQDIPRFQLMQGDSGPLFEAGFTDGQWVIACDTAVWDEDWDPVELTILRYEKAYMQQLDYGSDEMPKLYKTAAQAEADGLIPFGGHEVGYVSYAEAVVLVKQQYELQNIQGEPSQQFTEEFGDDRYAIALWRITGTAYKHAAKKIMGLLRTTLKDGLHTGTIKVEARKEKGKLKTYWVPQVRAGELHDEETLAWVVELAQRYDNATPVNNPNDQPAAADQSAGAQAPAKQFGVEPTRQPQPRQPLKKAKHEQLTPSADAPGPSAANAS